jgi:lipopolysaccharide transport system ATP-binding protein
MPDIAIRAEGVSKQYRINATRQKVAYRTLREALVQAAARIVGRTAGHAARAPYRTFQALQDVSFEIKRGEVVGIIGPNGAGKSTLLKILARITPPSAGLVEVHGRLGSLLEVGTGFHGELSGRENIYLSSAILGMSKGEVQRRFDEIVEFSELAEFIDTPVKHYSSGMYMKLAFAVAAHLEPEILIVDEVLAVGDARFQQKCLAKMQNIGEQGRTVIFVSHNMPVVGRLCARVLLLREGRLANDGPAATVISDYLRDGASTGAAREWTDPDRAPAGEVSRLCAVRVVRAADGKPADAVDIREPINVELEYEVLTPGYVLTSHFKFFNQDGIEAFSVFDTDPDWRRRPRPCGRYVTGVTVPGNFMAEGMMFVTAGQFAHLPVYKKQFYLRDIVGFQVVDSFEGDTARGDYMHAFTSVVRPLLPWSSRIVGP